MKKILQIVPCHSELYARYSQDGGEFTSRVVCLALVEEKVGSGGAALRSVVGLDATAESILTVEENANFLGYTDTPVVLPAAAQQPT